jgi:predicted nucleotidyltransferase component of viral defense system
MRALQLVKARVALENKGFDFEVLYFDAAGLHFKRVPYKRSYGALTDSIYFEAQVPGKDKVIRVQRRITGRDSCDVFVCADYIDSASHHNDSQYYLSHCKFVDDDEFATSVSKNELDASIREVLAGI